MLTQLDRDLDRILDGLTAPGGQFALGEATVRGQRYPAFVTLPSDMRAYLAAFAPLHGDKEFLVHGDERLTFSAVHQRALRLAGMLQHDCGIEKGDRVVIAMRNIPEWIELFLAIVHLGAVAVPLNAWWQGEELAYGVRDSGARLVFADEERARRLRSAAAIDVPIIAVGTGHARADELDVARLEDLESSAPAQPHHLPPIDPEDDVSIMYTSGSTGTPKGAVATHRALASGALNYVCNLLAMLVRQTEQGVAPAPQQIMLLNVPLFHITGLVPVTLVSLAIGRKLVMMPRWDAGEALRLIEAERCTYFAGVPTMTHELMLHPDRQRYDLSSLIDLAAGGAARPADHVERLAQTFPGKHAALGYGLTETSGVGCGNIRESYRARPQSTGRPSRPLVALRVVDDDGQDAPAGTAGEVWIRSVANVRGYWNRPEETAAAFTPDGWFKTGDIGRLDEDGYLFIVDRKKDIIIRGGENVSCQEVEAAVYRHPSVAEACVFGVADERLGETVAAVIHVTPGDRLEAEALTGFLKDHLAAFKLPERLWFSDLPLPRLGSAKIDKMSLRQRYGG